MPHQHTANLTCNQWLAFESSVLRRLQFRSVALPWADAIASAVQLKSWGVRVHTNHQQADAYLAGAAYIANNTEIFHDEDIARLTSDLYVPGYQLRFPELQRWFTEPEAWWFANLRNRADRLATPAARALALNLGAQVGSYALSFDDETRALRLSLTEAAHKLWARLPAPIDNKQTNTCSHQPPATFLAEQRVDLALIRLPRFAALLRLAPQASWSNIWLHEIDLPRDDDAHNAAHAYPSAHAPTAPSKNQYLRFVSDLLARAAHLPQWAIVHAADGFVSVEEILETIRRVRPVKTIYTKDFSEWMSTRANIIVA